MSRFTLDSATEFLFGNCVESLSAGLPYPRNAAYVPIVPRTAKGDAADLLAFIQQDPERFQYTLKLVIGAYLKLALAAEERDGDE